MTTFGMGVLDPTCFTCDGDLTLNGVEMMTPAWCVVNLLDVMGPGNLTLRGSDVIIPSASGRRFFTRRQDETKWTLQLVITGVVDLDGVPQSDPYQGLQDNIAYLNDFVITPSQTSLIEAVITQPNTDQLFNNVVVTGWKTGNRAGPMMLATMDITSPSGQFA